MQPHEQFAARLAGPMPLLALAPMQEVTDGAFWTLIHRYGGADVYWTQYSASTPSRRRKSEFSTPSSGTPLGNPSSRR